MGFKNFYIWRKRLPHWRADDVTYYTTFRHRRNLTPEECQELFRVLLSLNIKKWDVCILCVLPDKTELIVKTLSNSEGHSIDLSNILEPAKRKAAKRIQKSSSEKYSVFYQESFDRIIRNEQEYEERLNEILKEPIDCGLVDEDGNYEFLWLPQ
jgi:hypothetical protein